MMSTTSADQDDTPEPEVGEIRELTGFSWDPWVLVTRVEHDSDGNRLARWALWDNPDDDALTPVPDSWTKNLEWSVGDREWRRSIARRIDEDDDIDKRWCPVDRLEPIGPPGIQGCDDVVTDGGKIESRPNRNQPTEEPGHDAARWRRLSVIGVVIAGVAIILGSYGLAITALSTSYLVLYLISMGGDSDGTR